MAAAFQAALGRDRQVAFDIDVAVHGVAPPRARLRVAHRLQAHGTQNRKGIVQLEEIHIAQGCAGLRQRLLRAQFHGNQPERIRAVMDRQRVGGRRAAQNGHRRDMAGTVGQGRTVLRTQDHGRGAVADGTAVKHAQRTRDDPRPAVVLLGDGMSKHRMRIATAVAVGIDAESRQSGVRHVVLPHVALHHQGIERGEADPLKRFVDGVRSHAEGGGGVVPQGVGHLLHPQHQDAVVQAGGHRRVAHPEGGGAGGAGRFGLDRFHVAQAAEIGHRRRQILLPRQGAAQHVADKQGIHRLDVRVQQGRRHGFVGQMQNRLVPVLADFRLSRPYDAHLLHA